MLVTCVTVKYRMNQLEVVLRCADIAFTTANEVSIVITKAPIQINTWSTLGFIKKSASGWENCAVKLDVSAAAIESTHDILC